MIRSRFPCSPKLAAARVVGRPGPSEPTIGRAGLSLVELLLFVGILGLSTSALVGFFLFSTDGRIRQTIAGDVDQNAIQLQQFLEHEILQADSIIDPPIGKSGSILTLKVSDTASSPTIVSVVDTYMILIRRDAQYIFSSPDVRISAFRAYNTSPSADKPSVTVEYTLSRDIPTPNGGTYSKTIRQAVSVLPHQASSVCSCSSPVCDGGYYEWQICTSGACGAMSGVILC
jgi:hypothetical protein